MKKHDLTKKYMTLSGIILCLFFSLDNFKLNAANINQAEILPIARIPFMEKPPLIDGIINPLEWETLRVEGFVGIGDLLEQRSGTFWIGCGKKKLYIAIRSEIHPQGLIARNKSLGKKDVPRLIHDDCVEIRIDPHSRSESKDQKCFLIMINSLGAIYDQSYEPKIAKINKKWRGKYEIGQSVDKNFWNLEISIDLNSLGVSDESFKYPWGMRVCRNWKLPWTQARWAPKVTGFAALETMPLVLFNENAPIIQQLAYKDEERKKVSMRFRVKNITSKPMALKCLFGHNAIDQPRYFHEEEVTVAPGSEKIVKYEKNITAEANYRCVSEVRITSADGKIPYFLRDYAWSMNPNKQIWSSVRKQSVSSFDFAYYPYLNKLKAKVNVSGLKYQDKIEKIRLEVTPHDKDKVLVTDHFPAPSKSGEAELFIDIPELASGDYDVKLFLVGQKDVPSKPVIRTFERRYFLWEKNQIGISNEVIPPFTPIKVEKNTVKTILRNHKMTDTGIWKQVKSKGENILASPMSFEMILKNNPVPIEVSEFKFTEKKDHRTAGYSQWKAGDLKGRTEFEYDYDGMMKVILTLSAKNPVKIDQFSLRIPLKEPNIPLMHEVCDSMRSTYAGRIPEGRGIVWKSADASRNFLSGTFVPYVWMGGPERGICWFAESDENWSNDDKKSALTIERDGDVIYLNIYFINKKTVLTGSRKIVFGLQATPVKPQPKNWRLWQTKDPKVVYCATEAYWGGLNVSARPFNKDYSVVRKIDETRRTGVVDKVFFKNLFKTFDPREWAYPQPEKGFDQFKSSLWCGLYYMKSKPQIITTYTNPTGALTCTPEWWTFQDEWTFAPYIGRGKRTDKREIATLNETSTRLARSRMDFLLWKYNKLLEAGFDGIFWWDNFYPHSERDPYITGAYNKPDGSVQTSVNIFAMREFAKRIAVLTHQMGKKPRCNGPHMTTTNVIPTLSFADLTLDWEWKYGNADYQDRFPSDFILTESTGLQSGCIPHVLFNMNTKDKKKQKWIKRTMMGVSLVHELKSGWFFNKSDIYDLLHRFGYGKSGCEVYNYWDKKPVVIIKGIDAKFLALKKGDRLIVIVTDYGEGGEANLQLNFDQTLISKYKKVRNWETNETLPCKNGAITFPIKKHDFRVFLFGEGKF